MRKFAFFLPQFHEIEENNQWWGQGFTEWTNVKRAKPLYKNHIQPKHPFNDNYYNLLDKKTMEWQTSLLKEYRVDGLIYYHYWFDGKMLLEKPAENLLKWTDIDQPFFFCWANHDWNRSWLGKKEVILSQSYGGTDDLNRHFNYLLPFFCDDRYEKVENKPVFMLINCDIPEKNEIVEYFDTRCKQAGFDGIFFIESFNGARHWKKGYEEFKQQLSPKTSMMFLREHLTSHSIYRTMWRYYPYFALVVCRKKLCSIMKKPFLYIENGTHLYRIMIEKEPHSNSIIHGMFFEWDNTPRHGYRGLVITPPTKELFMRYMDTIEAERYVFINAWNEWAEGMMLEPTMENGFKYLEWIREWTVNHC